LIDFIVRQQPAGNQLTLTVTAGDNELQEVILQRSTDGINFTDIARVAAAGNSTAIKNYTYNDILSAAMQTEKTVFYRLRSVDIDGKFSYSQVIAIHLDKKEMQLLVSPNPAKDVLQVQTNAAAVENAALIIADAAGRQLYKKDLVLQPGSNSIPVNISFMLEQAVSFW
jgi:hypothetical protein